MRTTLFYYTKYGTTLAIAEMIKQRLRDSCDLVSISDAGSQAMAGAEIVVLGAPVYGGSVPRRFIRFCERYRDELLARPVALFISCFYRNEKAVRQIESSFPDWLLAHAHLREWLGGSVVPANLSVFDRLLVTRLGGVRGDIERIETERIDAFARALDDLGLQ